MSDTQPTLFNPSTTTPAYCTTCKTDRRNLCQHDADIRHNLIPPSATRPKTCLNRTDPAKMPFPEGY